MSIADPQEAGERSPAEGEGAGRPERGEKPENGDEASPGNGGTLLRRGVRLGLILLAVLVLLRTFVVAPYAIPTGSMYPAILEGDVILINTLPYYIRTPGRLPFTGIEIPRLELPGLGSLERGDVVVFVAPERRRSYQGTDRLVKRCVALAGDTLRLVSGLIEVNGAEPPLPAENEREDPAELPPMRRPINPDRAFDPLRNNRRVIVPYKGYDLLLPDSATVASWRGVIESEGTAVDYRNGLAFLNGRPATFYRFRRDYFFALGDRSGDSYDSRYFGFVPHENLIGRAMFVYWSRDPDGGIRWGRIGEMVR